MSHIEKIPWTPVVTAYVFQSERFCTRSTEWIVNALGSSVSMKAPSTRSYSSACVLLVIRKYWTTVGSLTSSQYFGGAKASSPPSTASPVCGHQVSGAPRRHRT